jgi:anti-anti-sigma regulatory factor
MEKVYFRLSDTVHEGVCFIRMEGYLCGRATSLSFRALADRRIQEGIRFFVFDILRLDAVDSTGLGTLAYAFTRLGMRISRFNLAYPNSGRVSDLFKVTKFETFLTEVEKYSTAEEAFSRMTNKSLESIAAILACEQRFTIVEEEPNNPRLVRDYAKLLGKDIKTCLDRNERVDPNFEAQANDQVEEPGNENSAPPASRLSEKAGEEVIAPNISTASAQSMILFALVAVLGIVAMLVWAAKQIPSTVVLALVFSVSTLFFVNIVAFVLVMSGHISEKSGMRLLNGILGKVPGLRLWLPRVLAGRKSSP